MRSDTSTVSPAPDAVHHEGEVQRRGAAAERHRVPASDHGGHLLLEGGEVGPGGRQPPGVEDREQRLALGGAGLRRRQEDAGQGQIISGADRELASARTRCGRRSA